MEDCRAKADDPSSSVSKLSLVVNLPLQPSVPQHRMQYSSPAACQT